MVELLTYIAKNLVDNPDEVTVTENVREDGEHVFELRVAPSDMGKVIGKHGRIAKEIRAIMKSAAIRRDIKVSVDIVD
ncbi:MAG: KH domain-containing protein [Clostridia bacterium]|nr:KH domain-containing protein [Clostridia bacterium]